MTEEEWNGADLGEFFEKNGHEVKDDDIEVLGSSDGEDEIDDQ